MSLRAVVFIAVLAWAAPGLAAGKTDKAIARTLAATNKPADSASGGSCCDGSGGGSCGSATQPAHDALHSDTDAPSPLASEETWREFVRKVYEEEPEPEAEPPDADPFAFSVYRGVRPEPMGSQTLINGARMDIATLIVEDPPHMVMNFYREAMVKAGLHYIVGRVDEVPGMTYLSFRPAGSQNMKTVTLVPHGAGTVILASVGNPEELIQGRPPLPRDVPLPPNAEMPTAIQQMEPGLASRSSLFVVRDSSVQKIQAFYREELTRRGFVPVTVQDGLPGMESYQKGSTLLSISAKPHSDPTAVAVGILWLDQ
ncbi:hypothetical protein JQX13_51225 [Archangium violaceum]|uniref:hypothetical protein n=1 Tax=Archangium violaceum TaxID=83451 RepID=UPI00193C113C|nr:hypothetical protein [Archangium violaceum]QRK08214.1 hypothetical protein JQX13_51225 [Archangium violaceum]